MTKPLAVASLLIALSTPASAGPYEIKNCPIKPRKDLKAAATFLEDNMSALVDRYTFLTEKQTRVHS